VRRLALLLLAGRALGDELATHEDAGKAAMDVHHYDVVAAEYQKAFELGGKPLDAYEEGLAWCYAGPGHGAQAVKSLDAYLASGDTTFAERAHDCILQAQNRALADAHDAQTSEQGEHYGAAAADDESAWSESGDPQDLLAEGHELELDGQRARAIATYHRYLDAGGTDAQASARITALQTSGVILFPELTIDATGFAAAGPTAFGGELTVGWQWNERWSAQGSVALAAFTAPGDRSGARVDYRVRVLRWFRHIFAGADLIGDQVFAYDTRTLRPGVGAEIGGLLFVSRRFRIVGGGTLGYVIPDKLLGADGLVVLRQYTGGVFAAVTLGVQLAWPR
jgi:hypothetical protein